jgi:transcriptional regulator with XRE-family HTH domain
MAGMSASAAAVIRTARLRAGLSIRKLARRAGTSHATLWRYEHETVQPSFATVERIVRACDLELRVHLDEPDTTDAELADSFRALTPRQRLESIASVDRLHRRAG